MNKITIQKVHGKYCGDQYSVICNGETPRIFNTQSQLRRYVAKAFPETIGQTFDVQHVGHGFTQPNRGDMTPYTPEKPKRLKIWEPIERGES